MTEHYIEIPCNTEVVIRLTCKNHDDPVIIDCPAPIETPVEEPTPDPVVVIDPVVEPTPDPIVEEPTPDPVVDPIIDPVVEPTPDPVIEPVPVEPGTDPVMEPTPDPVVVVEPTPDPVIEPTPTPDPVIDPVVDPVVIVDPIIEVPAPTPDPVIVDPVPTPTPEPTPDPVVIVEPTPIPDPITPPIDPQPPIDPLPGDELNGDVGSRLNLADFTKQLAIQTKGLLYPSESDLPIEVIAKGFSNKMPKVPGVTVRNLNRIIPAFLRNVDEDDQQTGNVERAALAARWKGLYDLIRRNAIATGWHFAVKGRKYTHELFVILLHPEGTVALRIKLVET